VEFNQLDEKRCQILAELMKQPRERKKKIVSEKMQE